MTGQWRLGNHSRTRAVIDERRVRKHTGICRMITDLIVREAPRRCV
jgi:hypothetical protein